MKTIRIEVFGKVQGVYFRQATKAFCNQTGIKGQVRNRKDGSVEIIAQGSDSAIEQLSDWAKVGPSKAAVEKIIVEEIQGQEFTDFSIVR